MQCVCEKYKRWRYRRRLKKIVFKMWYYKKSEGKQIKDSCIHIKQKERKLK